MLLLIATGQKCIFLIIKRNFSLRNQYWINMYSCIILEVGLRALNPVTNFHGPPLINPPPPTLKASVSVGMAVIMFYKTGNDMEYGVCTCTSALRLIVRPTA